MVMMSVKPRSIKALEKKKKFIEISKSQQRCNSSQNTRQSFAAAGTNKSPGTLNEAVGPSASQEKALRAAMLKKRFADTIFKATNQQVLDNVSDPSTREKEKQRLAKEHKRELAKIDAQIKAAETASRLKIKESEAASRLKAREAARKAVENVKKTVEFNDYAAILDDLEKMGFRRSDFY